MCNLLHVSVDVVIMRVLTNIVIVQEVTPFLPFLPFFLAFPNSDFSEWTGAIRIRYEADERTLVIRGGEISIAPGSEPSEVNLTVSQTQLLKLLFGNMTAEQIVFSNGLIVSESEIGLLDVLFPSGDLFMWRTDRF